MGNVRLIAFDLDGTLFNDKKEVTPETFRTLERAAEMGIEIVPATGRFWDAIPDNVKALDFVRYALTLNGAAIFDVKERRTIAEFPIPAMRAETLCRVFGDLGVVYDFVADGKGYMRRDNYERLAEVMIGEWQVKIVRDMRSPVDDVYDTLSRVSGVQKMQIYTKDAELRANLMKSLPHVFPRLLFTSSVPNNIEINDTRANKGDGLRFLAGHLGVAMGDTLAFGDGLNDIAMIEAAGIGVAMGNAADEVKNAADYVTVDNNNNGVAEGIKRFCFGQ
ncbi:MAG: HAD family phosphatase [Synergistaceae bacterium]|nr:HAD family phosphatase [Synergistaceae bacterium]